MNAELLKLYIMECGATLVGVGDVSAALPAEIAHLNRAISIAVDRSLNARTVALLSRLQRETVKRLKEAGWRYLSIPPDSDRRKGKFISNLYELFSHKTAATCSGLGWVGKNGLVINREYGPKLSWATVLTDAPLEADPPIVISECGDCDFCVRHCPSGAIKGGKWSVAQPFNEYVSYERCRSLKGERKIFEEKPNCGLCITICPYARKNRQKNEETKLTKRL